MTPCILQEGLIMLIILLLLGSAAALVLVSAKPGEHTFIHLFIYLSFIYSYETGCGDKERLKGHRGP